MDPKLLEYFLRVAEFGSINRAASDLRVSQPALSRHMAALEHQVRTKLFVRTSRGVRLTEAGIKLSEKGRPLLRQIDLLKEDLSQQAGGQVALGMPVSWQAMITAPLVKRALDDFPQIAIRVYEGLNSQLLELMASALVDAGVVSYGAPHAPGFTLTPLIRESLILVGHRNADLDPESPVSLSRLRQINLVLPSRTNALTRYVEDALNRQRYPARIVTEAESAPLCLELTRQGVGYTIMPQCALCDELPGTNFSWAPIRNLQVTWILVENRSRLHSSAVRKVRQLLLEQVKMRLREREWPGARQIMPIPT